MFRISRNPIKRGRTFADLWSAGAGKKWKAGGGRWVVAKCNNLGLEDLFVVGVGADPEPDNGVAGHDAEGTVARYRALGIMTGDTVVWFWIGTHADYEQILKA